MRKADAHPNWTAGAGVALLLNLSLMTVSSQARGSVDLTGTIGGDLNGPAGPCALPSDLVSGPGALIPVTFQNLGSSDAKPATYRLWMSKTNSLPFDTSGGTATNVAFPPDGAVDLAGFETLERCVAATVPSVAEGDYYLVLQMDPDDAYPNDTNLQNNIAFSRQMVHVPSPAIRVTNIVPPADCFQGRATDIGFSLTNDGPIDADGFSVGLFLVPEGGALTTTAYEVAQIDGVSLKTGCAIVVRQGAVVFANSDGCYVWPANPIVEVVPPSLFDRRKVLPGIYNAGVIADVTNLVLPRTGRDTNHLLAAAATVCRSPEPDLSIRAAELLAPSEVSAGSKIMVDRTIRNLGVEAATARYGYFLNLDSVPGTLEVHQGGVPIPVALPSGEITYAPSVTVDYFGHGSSEDRASELLVIPSTLVPPPGARYTLALVLDPTNQLQELDKANNLAGVGPIEVTKTDLVIGGTNPPAALAAVPYVFSFEASGGFGDYVWSIAAGASPPQMTLGEDGVLGGTPTELGNWQFLVQVASGGETQVALVAFTVVPPSGPLQVVKSGPELPPATVGELYAAQLAAQGGTPPYLWTASAQSLPDGLGLSASGLLSGTPTRRALTARGPAALAVTVTDQAGNSKFDTYLLQVGESGALVITTTGVPPYRVNEQWVFDVFAVGCEGTDPNTPWCHFTIPAGQSVPAGVQLTTLGKGKTAYGRLSGIVSQAGIWVFEVQVTDDAGHLARAHLRLEVFDAPLALPNQDLPSAVRGEPYAAQLKGLSGVATHWLLYSGDLPPGLALNSDGSILGTVDPMAGTRTYAFTASARDDQGNQSLQAEAITVLPDTQTPKTGCATGPGEPAMLGLLGLALLAPRQRRRSPPSCLS